MQLQFACRVIFYNTDKIRKLIITSGAYERSISVRTILFTVREKSIREIQELTGPSVASIRGYLPSQKTVYKMEEITVLAERLRKYRNRKNAVKKLRDIIMTENSEKIKDLLWDIPCIV